MYDIFASLKRSDIMISNFHTNKDLFYGKHGCHSTHSSRARYVIVASSRWRTRMSGESCGCFVFSQAHVTKTSRGAWREVSRVDCQFSHSVHTIARVAELLERGERAHDVTQKRFCRTHVAPHNILVPKESFCDSITAAPSRPYNKQSLREV